jgi:single-stranded-DNA-specific exonuclease
MVKQGLNNILNETNDGIRALMKVSKLDANSLTVGKLGYWFIPKINAAGRLGDAGRAVKLFTTINPQLANQIALDLENENEKRKIITMQHENDAQRIIDSSINLEKQKIIIIYKEDWHFGVVGIVASRVKDKYNFPTIVLTEDKGFFKGSCRSVSGFDIVNALSSCSDLLENFGGHPMAAGLSIKKENLDLFIIRMNDYAIENIKTSLKPILNIDYMLDFNEINSRFIKFLDHLEPYGPGNPKPIFATQKVKGFNDLELLGKDRNVLKCKINSPHIDLEVIGFQMVENYEKLLSYKNVDISYQIDKNIWRGKESIQLVLKDVIYSDE